MQAFETSNAQPQWATPPTRPHLILLKQLLQVKTKHSNEPTGTILIQASFTLILFNFTDQTKITYKAAATEDAIPTALEKGTHNGNIPPIQPGPSPNGLNSGQMAN